MKATWAQIDGKPVELFKDPLTDSGMKKSAKGLLRVDKENNTYVLKQGVSREEANGGCLELVYLNGKIMRTQTLQEIRDNVLNS